MRIMIDGMNLALEQGTGVATYSKNLSYCLRLKGHEVTALYGKPMRAYDDDLLREAMFFDIYKDRRSRPEENVLDVINAFLPKTAAKIPTTDKVLKNHIANTLPDVDHYLNYTRLFKISEMRTWMHRGVMNIRLPEPVDIAHWTYPLPIRVDGAKNIYTLHDLVPLKLPYTTLDSKSAYYRTLRHLAKTADHFVTVSETSKTDIMEILGVDESFVTNTYQSVRIPQALLDEPLEQVQINLDAMNVGADLGPGGFYLFVGAIEPKKNLKRVVEAYLQSGCKLPFIVVGRKAWQFQDVMSLVERSNDIFYLDYLPFNQLITLIRAARGVFFPSLYEGFGLPVLEAFICGAPVVTADASSTREIAGDAAMLVDPYDIRQIRDAFRKLEEADNEQMRFEMTERGRAQAALFHEDVIADNLDAMYRKVLAG